MTEGTELEVDQIVWAKIRGYPWWPGVISDSDQSKLNNPIMLDEIRYTVKFIGENSHAVLSSKSINDFEKYYVQHSQTKVKWLSTCIAIAKRLYDGELDVSNFTEINAGLVNKNMKVKKQKPESITIPAPEPKELSTKLERLKQLIEQKILNNTYQPSDLKRKKYSFSLKKHQKLLSDFKAGQEPNLNDLCESLYALTKMEVTANLLEASPIKKIVKLLGEECTQSSCETLQEVASIAQRLRDYWKIISDSKKIVTKEVVDESYIADNRLRKHVCCKIAKLLENNSFDIKEAQEMALIIEKNLRRKDPSMSSRYRNYYSHMMKDIKNITPNSYAAARETLSTCS